MKDPKPIHLSSDDYFRSHGWAAVSRDSDGHAMTCHAPFDTAEERAEYEAEEKARGNVVIYLL